MKKQTRLAVVGLSATAMVALFLRGLGVEDPALWSACTSVAWYATAIDVLRSRGTGEDRRSPTP